MTQQMLDESVARSTGEDSRTIRRHGFVVLTRGPVESEPEREPEGDAASEPRNGTGPSGNAFSTFAADRFGCHIVSVRKLHSTQGPFLR